MRTRILPIFLPLLVFFVTGLDLGCGPYTGTVDVLDNISYCYRDTLNLPSNEIITSVNGVATPTTYHGLRLINSKFIPSFPKGLATLFPQLRAIHIWNCGLQSIQAADLAGLSNLESINFEHNAITVVSDDLLKFTPKVFYLNLADNKLTYVGENLLKSFYSFKDIDLKDNKGISTSSDFENFKRRLQKKCSQKEYIENNTEFAKLKTQQIAEMSRLKLENERLKRTSNRLLDSVTKLLYKESMKLKECRKRTETDDTPEPGVEIVLKVASATENATELEMSIESPESKVTKVVVANGNVMEPTQAELVIDQQSALFLPVNLGQFFPTIKQLAVTFSGLYELDTRTFIGMQALVTLNLTGNKLIEISEDALAELSILKELDLSHNNIEVVHENVFEENVELDTLRLNHNKLAGISSPIFKHQKKLRLLFLNDNRLKFLNAMLLPASKVLEIVDLGNNDCIDLALPNATLKEIEARILNKCIVPVELKCDHESQNNEIDKTYCKAEKLTLIHPGTTLTTNNLLNAKKIQVMCIIDQKTFFIPSQLSETLPQLVKLVVEKSQLKALAKPDFRGMTLLTEIKIDQNNISEIEEGVFDEVPQLVYLSLAYNNIISLPSRAFAMLTNLKTLVLSGNHLLKFTASQLPRRNVITDLQLQENKLEFIESKLFRWLRKVETIDLSNNTCVDMKYEKSESEGTSLKDLSGHIEFECSNSAELS